MGIIAALISALFSTSKDLVSKRLSFSVDGTTSTFASFAFALPFYILLIVALYLAGLENFEIGVGFVLLVLIRSITDAAAEWLKMTALGLGEISLVVCFFSLSPVFLAVASPLITGDQLSVLGIVGLILIAAGSIVVIFRPRSSIEATLAADKARNRAILLATLASVFFALNTCFDRLAVQQASAALSGFAMTGFSAILFLPAIISSPTRISGLVDSAKPFLIRGGLEVGFMVLKLLALQYLTAPEVVGIQRLSMVASVIGGAVFFGERGVAQKLLGALVIAVGSLMVVFAG